MMIFRELGSSPGDAGGSREHEEGEAASLGGDEHHG
jgi:hypothetical protein